jgi:transposase
MDPRQERGLVIAALTKIDRHDGKWLVPSQSINGRKYAVDLGRQTCECPDCQEAGFKCKHQWEVEFVLKLELGADGTITETRTMTVTQRKTYRQEWRSYNLAQSTEKHRFQVLLHELCRGIEERPTAVTGRKPHRVSDMIFASVFKVYSTFSSRRFSCDLKDAFERGYTSRPIPGMKVNVFLENAALTLILQKLVALSSLPLQAVECDFAPDSTGFSACRFVRWTDEKYGEQRSGRDWVKAHIVTGVKSNIITSIRIEDRNASDCVQFSPMVAETSEHFTIREMSADKAYLSHENLELVAAAGGTAYIPFKTGTVPGKPGTLWEKMYFYYNLKREEFLSHYHKRSLVESTFSMLKAKFRDGVRSKTPVAMKNEVLCKALAHNLCVVIQSQCELGIEADFWQDQGRADVLPLARA